MDSTVQAVENDSGIFKSLFDMEYNSVYEPVFDIDGNYTGQNRNCTEITLTITNLKKGEKDYVSGNGVAMLSLETEIEKFTLFNETVLDFPVYDDDTFMGINDSIWKSINKKLVDFNNTQFDNVNIVYCDDSTDAEKTNLLLGLTFKGDGVKVIIQQVNLTVSAKI